MKQEGCFLFPNWRSIPSGDVLTPVGVSDTRSVGTEAPFPQISRPLLGRGKITNITISVQYVCRL